MTNKSDSELLASRFSDTFPTRGKITDNAIAAACRVTKQAVGGWRKTGRIRKSHIPILAKLSETDLEYWLTGISGDYSGGAQPSSSGANHSRKLVQSALFLAEKIDDEGLKELISLARLLIKTHPHMPKPTKAKEAA